MDEAKHNIVRVFVPGAVIEEMFKSGQKEDLGVEVLDGVPADARLAGVAAVTTAGSSATRIEFTFHTFSLKENKTMTPFPRKILGPDDIPKAAEPEEPTTTETKQPSTGAKGSRG